MTKKNATRFFEGKFGLYYVNLDVKVNGKVVDSVHKRVAGTEQGIKHYIRDYLKPPYRGNGRKLNVRYTNVAENIDTLIASNDMLAT